MPTEAECHSMANLCGFLSFKHLDYTQRMKVIRLVIEQKRNDILAAIQNDTDSIAKAVWDN